eukprot:scaffold94607_cov27-Tisochrysis_lutea.AAC.2
MSQETHWGGSRCGGAAEASNGSFSARTAEDIRDPTTSAPRLGARRANSAGRHRSTSRVCCCSSSA